MKSDTLEALVDFRAPLEKAFALGGAVESFADVLQSVANGTMQLFTSGGSALLTQIQEYPRARVLQLCYAGGRLSDMEPWLDAVLSWGRRKGCTKVVMIGRDGWERTFLGKHLRPTHVVMQGTL